MAILITSLGKRAVFGICCFLLTVGWTESVRAIPSTEYQLKAVFLFNFAQFVDWPANAFPTPETPLVIGILGDDPFDDYLEEIVRGEKVNNRPFVIKHYRGVEDVDACHVLFVSRSMTGRMPQILSRLRGRSILTVGDANNFAASGGMIRFVTDNSKIRLRVNMDATNAAHLTISSKLLRAAEVVGSGKD